jgi:TRAP-type C4-dicarboxylate transport system substrate-binding protein
VRRVIAIIFTVLLVSAVIFGGCAKEEAPTTPTTPTAPTEPTEPTEPVKPIEWTFVSFMPPFDIFATAAEDWGKELEEATGGRLKITFYWAESLIKISGLFESVASGTADMATHPLAFYPERLSLAWVGSLPGIFDNPVQTGMDVLNKYEEMREQFLPCRVAWLQDPGPFELTSKQPVRTMEDLNGLKISTGLKFEMLSYEALGGVPLSVHPTEAYHALETGVIDASCLDFNGIFIWKLHEVTQYRIGNTLGLMTFMPTVINIESYNKLPADIQQKYDELTDPIEFTNSINEAFVEFWAGSIEGIKEYDKKTGLGEFYYLPAEEHERWVETIWPITDVWVEENEAKGYPARAILEDTIAFAAQYK